MKLQHLLLALLLASISLHADERPRLAVLSDIGGDPDDQQSLIHLMVYANEFDLELLMATAVRKKHWKNGPTTRPHLIHEIVEAYGKVLPNLQRHATGWPSVEQLHARTLSGNPRYQSCDGVLDHQRAVEKSARVPGVLQVFDLPDCYRELERKKLRQIEPAPAAGVPA